MSEYRRVMRIATLVAGLTGCAENTVVHTSPDTPSLGNERATVTGHVVDVNGAPVAGAQVALRLTGEHATADSAGAFVLDVPANTTLTLAASAPSMAPTLAQQFIVSPSASAEIDIPLLATEHLKALTAMGSNPAGGAIAIAVKSLSGADVGAAGATVQLTPSLGKVLYTPGQTGTPGHAGIPDPDPTMMSVVPGIGPVAWALGVQPHVSIMTLTLHGASQVESPHAVDDVIWPGTFTVDAGALTLVTLFTP